MEDRVLTLHPDKGKSGRRISRDKYETVRATIVRCLKAGPLTHADLMRCATAMLVGFDGSITWYVETVKLDLEARRIIKRAAKKPETYRLVGGG